MNKQRGLTICSTFNTRSMPPLRFIGISATGPGLCFVIAFGFCHLTCTWRRSRFGRSFSDFSQHQFLLPRAEQGIEHESGLKSTATIIVPYPEPLPVGF